MLVELTNTVGKLKERLEEVHCLQAKHLRLLFNNILLSDLDTLLVSGVQHGSVLIEVQGALELFGGAPHPVCCSPSPPLG